MKSFIQLSEKLLSRNKRQSIILQSGIDLYGKSLAASQPKPKTLKELQATHHVPGKIQKYFELDELEKIKQKEKASGMGIESKGKRKSVGTSEQVDPVKTNKKHAKINEIIYNLLEESAHLSYAMKKEHWEITTIHHTATKSIVYYKIDETVIKDGEFKGGKEDVIELISQFQPAFQKAFNAQYLQFNKWSAKRNEMPKILLRNDESLSRTDSLNALLDKIDLEQKAAEKTANNLINKQHENGDNKIFAKYFRSGYCKMLMETSVPYSAARIKSDLKSIDQLADMITKLELLMDVNMLDMFQKLQELAGSRDFYPFYSQIHHFVFKLKWAREGCWETGYIVPWMSLYSHIGINSHLVGVATHYGNSVKDNGFVSPSLIKAPPNPFGNGKRPVELNRDEWNQMLSSFLSVNPHSFPFSPSSSHPAGGASSGTFIGGKRPMPSPIINSANGANIVTSNCMMNHHLGHLPESHHASMGHAQKKQRFSPGMGASSPTIHGPLGSISLSPAELAMLTTHMNNNPDYNAILNHVLITSDSKSPKKGADSSPLEHEPVKSKSRRQNIRPVKQATTSMVIPSASAAENTTSTSLHQSEGRQAPQVAPAADDV